MLLRAHQIPWAKKKKKRKDTLKHDGLQCNLL